MISLAALDALVKQVQRYQAQQAEQKLAGERAKAAFGEQAEPIEIKFEERAIAVAQQ